MDEGRIEFVTFHQSYGYEEFVEGFRPIPTESKEGNGLQVSLVRVVSLGALLKGQGRSQRSVLAASFKMSLGDPKSWGGKPDGDAVFQGMHRQWLRVAGVRRRHRLVGPTLRRLESNLESLAQGQESRRHSV